MRHRIIVTGGAGLVSSAPYRHLIASTPHVPALIQLMHEGHLGETCNIGGNCNSFNLDTVERMCAPLDRKMPTAKRRRSLIKLVDERPGHDFRCAINASKIEQELGWTP